MLYQVEPLFPGLTRVWDVSHTAMYLAQGEERALLIDTGVGVGDLKAVVESLTDKPLTVLITHGHVDHAMGAAQFEDVYISPFDRQIYEEHSTLETRKGYVMNSAMQGGNPAVVGSLTDADYLPVRTFDSFLPLAPGDHFDLGGISAEVLPGQGHTQGSVTILFPEWRVLLLGDACNSFTFLFAADSSPVTAYRKMLLELKAKTDGKYDRTLFSHGMGEGTPDMIERVIAVCDDILANRTDDVPFKGFMADEHCFIAKAMDFAHFGRADGGEGNIVYNKRKLV